VVDQPPEALPYGSWPSPISAPLLVQDAVTVRELLTDGSTETLWWLEGRPAEGGRQVIVRWDAGSGATDLVPAGFSARTRVHEYGGGAFSLRPDGEVWFSNQTDQRLWRVRPGADPQPVTPEPPQPASVRFADGRAGFYVREQHLSAHDVVNDLVAVSGAGDVEVVAEGSDFYAAPRPSPDGTRSAWLQWDHPNMPWDGTELRVDGQLVAGGVDESVVQPRWSPDGRLHWVSDRTGWWNVYSEDDPDRPVVALAAECAGPLWTFGQASYAFLADGRLAITWLEGAARLGLVEDRQLRPVPLAPTALSQVRSAGSRLAAIAASPTEPPAVVLIDPESGAVEVVRRTQEPVVGSEWISVPCPIDVGGVRAFHYPPRNPAVVAPSDERPPLVVMSHGGPTGSFAPPMLDLEIQYWTTRGVAVVEVDYRGSAGWGREYRRALDGLWGIVDVEDCIAVARFLAEAGEVDGDRLAITGGSAGGYTVLCALVFHDVFAVGASHYGVGDLEALALETHKFEARYLDRMVAPYPEGRDVYVERSPLHFADRLSVPVILFQGLDDKVVPPGQAESFAAALRAKGVPFAHVTFEAEAHGFRKAETIVRVAEAELWFFGQVLGFTPADAIEPVPIEGSSPRAGMTN
jgi:dipeptidyl aminopeptidase/acylaminoacyl peptidase